MSNTIMVIFPYWCQDTWMFDDEHLGITQEPFISGIPEMIDTLILGIPNAKQGFKLLFSETPFPQYQVELVWMKDEYGGNWYRWESENMEGWLCPALSKYFREIPKKLYCKAEKLRA